MSLDLTQPEMIKKLAVKEKLYPVSISEYERGKREPPLLVLLRYAKVAGVSTDVLIDDRLNLPNR
jgi:transcriptional regulator with XRE-family HTH domain